MYTFWKKQFSVLNGTKIQFSLGRGGFHLFTDVPGKNYDCNKRIYKTKRSFLKTKHDFFENYFFPSTVIEWNKLDSPLRKSNSHKLFEKKI